MITRLKVNGFKNLVNVDVHFGAFTCIAGANGVGKSNLFDAIRFLSSLADQRLINAAQQVRDGQASDVRSLFTQGAGGRANRMEFLVEMIVPRHGEDDLGQEAEASITFLQYELEIGFTNEERRATHGGLEILKENLSHINTGDATKHLPFHPGKDWRESAVKGRQQAKLISTEENTERAIIKLHFNRPKQEGEKKGSGGTPLPYIAANLPKTVLSEVSSTEHRTALLARREMQSWRLLQLEPTALRQPDNILSPQHLNEKGEHLPATLYRLEKESTRSGNEPGQVYARIANRLAELIDDVRSVGVDLDEKRDLLTLQVEEKSGVSHTARFLSDGTLRFLALATLEQDMGAQGVICLEEPENGIHPNRIPAIMRLLEDIATDTDYAIAPENSDNPLRQVIINTHSPLVVQIVNPNDLLVAAPVTAPNGDRYLQCGGLRNNGTETTWRANAASEPSRLASLGDLLGYLGVSRQVPSEGNVVTEGKVKVSTLPASPKRVIDRSDVRQLQRSLFDFGKEN